MAHTALDLGRKLFIITGASRGIGLATARSLAGMGADIVMACRDPERGAAAMTEHVLPHSARTDKQDIRVLPLDLSRMSSVARFMAALADTHGDRVPHCLIHNAGCVVADRRQTEDGEEWQWQVNYLAPAAISHALLGRHLPRAAASVSAVDNNTHLRVVHVGAAMSLAGQLPPRFHRDGDESGSGTDSDDATYDPWKAYKASKLAMAVTSKYMAGCLQYADSRGLSLDAPLPFTVTADSVTVDPGWTRTDLVRADNGFSAAAIDKAMKGAAVGDDGVAKAAASVLQAALPDAASGTNTVPSGSFIMRGKPARVHPDVNNGKVQQRLWAYTLEWLRKHQPSV